MMKSLRCNPFNARVNSSTLVPGARHVSMSSDWKPQRLAACPCRQLGNLRDSPRVHVVSLETSGTRHVYISSAWKPQGLATESLPGMGYS
jgi:hypothetical protein